MVATPSVVVSHLRQTLETYFSQTEPHLDRFVQAFRLWVNYGLNGFPQKRLEDQEYQTIIQTLNLEQYTTLLTDGDRTLSDVIGGELMQEYMASQLIAARIHLVKALWQFKKADGKEDRYWEEKLNVLDAYAQEIETQVDNARQAGMSQFWLDRIHLQFGSEKDLYPRDLSYLQNPHWKYSTSYQVNSNACLDLQVALVYYCTRGLIEQRAPALHRQISVFENMQPPHKSNYFQATA